MWVELGTVVVVAALVRAYFSRRGPRVIQGEEARPYHTIPGAPGWPIIGTVLDLYSEGYVGKFHVFMMDRFAKYGPIVREKAFNTNMVFISGLPLIEELARKDGKYPALAPLSPWVDYRKRRNHAMGLLTSNGELWKKLRSPWNHTMLKTTNVYSGIENLNDINTDFITRIQERRNEKGIVKDIDRELFRWSLESACCFLFEKRFQCLSDDNEESDRFISAVKDMFLTMEELLNVPVFLAKILMRDMYQRHDKAWDIITERAKACVDAKVEEMAADKDEGVESEGFLSYVISTHQLTPAEIYSTVSEIMAAAVDTTSNTTQFVLYELSINPEVQNKVYQEVCDVTGGGFPTADHLRKMDYLKATVRDVQRLYPVAFGGSRTLQEDIVIGGYHLPAGTSILADAVANGRNPELFKDPLKLKPERWLKGGEGEDINSLSSIIFGFGSRGCIGRKTAEAEMYVLIARLLQKFELKFGGDKPVEICTRGLMTPAEPVPVCFKDRD